jgi:hypothetical protein
MEYNKKDKTMDEVSKGYEEFIKGRKIKSSGKKKFDETIKKTIKKKQPDSK